MSSAIGGATTGPGKSLGVAWGLRASPEELWNLLGVSRALSPDGYLGGLLGVKTANLEVETANLAVPRGSLGVLGMLSKTSKKLCFLLCFENLRVLGWLLGEAQGLKTANLELETANLELGGGCVGYAHQ